MFNILLFFSLFVQESFSLPILQNLYLFHAFNMFVMSRTESQCHHQQSFSMKRSLHVLSNQRRLALKVLCQKLHQPQIFRLLGKRNLSISAKHLFLMWLWKRNVRLRQSNQLHLQLLLNYNRKQMFELSATISKLSYKLVNEALRPHECNFCKAYPVSTYIPSVQVR